MPVNHILINLKFDYFSYVGEKDNCCALVNIWRRHNQCWGRDVLPNFFNTSRKKNPAGPDI